MRSGGAGGQFQRHAKGAARGAPTLSPSLGYRRGEPSRPGAVKRGKTPCAGGYLAQVLGICALGRAKYAAQLQLGTRVFDRQPHELSFGCGCGSGSHFIHAGEPRTGCGHVPECHESACKGKRGPWVSGGHFEQP